MSRDRLAKLKTEVLEQALFIEKAQQNNIIHAKKNQNTSLVFKDQLILMFQTDNISGSSLPGRSSRYESTFGFGEFGLPSQIDFA